MFTLAWLQSGHTIMFFTVSQYAWNESVMEERQGKNYFIFKGHFMHSIRALIGT